MLYLYSLIRYKNHVRSTDIVRVISGCFCSYSSMKLLYSVICMSYFECATILSLYEVMIQKVYYMYNTTMYMYIYNTLHVFLNS